MNHEASELRRGLHIGFCCRRGNRLHLSSLGALGTTCFPNDIGWLCLVGTGFDVNQSDSENTWDFAAIGSLLICVNISCQVPADAV